MHNNLSDHQLNKLMTEILLYDENGIPFYFKAFFEGRKSSKERSTFVSKMTPYHVH